jgi:hypothetical protein
MKEQGNVIPPKVQSPLSYFMDKDILKWFNGEEFINLVWK